MKQSVKVAFSLNNMTKDLKLAVKETERKRFQILSQIEKLYIKTQKKGLGKEDMSAVTKILK